MAYEVAPLPYAYDALAPVIDEETMHLHHDKHHQAYVDKANGALAGTEWEGKPIEEVLAILDALPENIRGVVRNNGGGHANHALFWEIMAAPGSTSPSGALLSAIESSFGSLDAMKEKVNAAGVGQFGSGWAWVVADGGSLAVAATPNQDTPLMQGKTPILGVDVWEHAYYLTYRNRRPDYLAAWWDVVNWDAVAARHAAATA